VADYATLAAKMDAQVDNRLGDSISYKREEDADYLTVKAFLVFDAADSVGYAPRDPVRQIVRLKIAKSVRTPKMSDRIRSPLLDGTYRPINGTPLTAGRYWLADLQKV
jgi:hypothetical protein